MLPACKFVWTAADASTCCEGIYGVIVRPTAAAEARARFGVRSWRLTLASRVVCFFLFGVRSR